MNEELIKIFYGANELINNGSGDLRRYVDQILLPAAQNDLILLECARGIRREFTSGDQKAKAYSFKAIKYLKEEPAEIHQLDALWRHAHPDWFPHYGNVFAKCGLINKVEYSEEDFIRFIDWLAETNACNTLKLFLDGQWGYDTYHLVHMPHPYNSITETFDITRMNPEWWDTVVRRLHELAKRRIRPVLITDYLVNAYHSHWTAQDRNDGWYGQKLYWDRDYGLWQWEEYADAPPEAFKEYREGTIDKATAEEWARQYAANRDYQFMKYEYVYSKLEAEFGKWIMYHHNEVPAGGNWHGIKARIMDSHGIPKRRRVTSTYLDFMTKGEVYENYILDVHGIKSKEEYFSAVTYLLQHGIDVPIIASSDGKGYFWFKDAEQTQKEAEDEYWGLLTEVVTDGNMYWGNEWWYNPYDPVCDIEVLKKRLERPNKILKEILTIS